MSDFGSGIILGVFLSVIVAVPIIGGMQDFYRTSAIEHNCAAYDSQTGEWDWINKED